MKADLATDMLASLYVQIHTNNHRSDPRVFSTPLGPVLSYRNYVSATIVVPGVHRNRIPGMRRSDRNPGASILNAPEFKPQFVNGVTKFRPRNLRDFIDIVTILDLKD